MPLAQVTEVIVEDTTEATAVMTMVVVILDLQEGHLIVVAMIIQGTMIVGLEESDPGHLTMTEAQREQQQAMGVVQMAMLGRFSYLILLLNQVVS